MRLLSGRWSYSGAAGLSAIYGTEEKSSNVCRRACSMTARKGAEAKRFNRLLIDAGLIKNL